METNPKDIEWLLHDLSATLVFGMAVRDPDRFIALAYQGPHFFADEVMLAAGLDPNDPTLDNRLRRGVHQFVAARFQLWTSRGAPDPSAKSDDR